LLAVVLAVVAIVLVAVNKSNTSAPPNSLVPAPAAQGLASRGSVLALGDSMGNIVCDSLTVNGQTILKGQAIISADVNMESNNLSAKTLSITPPNDIGVQLSAVRGVLYSYSKTEGSRELI